MTSYPPKPLSSLALWRWNLLVSCRFPLLTTIHAVLKWSFLSLTWSRCGKNRRSSSYLKRRDVHVMSATIEMPIMVIWLLWIEFIKLWLLTSIIYHNSILVTLAFCGHGQYEGFVFPICSTNHYLTVFSRLICWQFLQKNMCGCIFAWDMDGIHTYYTARDLWLIAFDRITEIWRWRSLYLILYHW